MHSVCRGRDGKIVSCFRRIGLVSKACQQLRRGGWYVRMIVLQPHYDLGAARRLWPLERASERLTGVELATLLLAGALAAVAVAAITLSLRVPGHAILRGTLPIVFGFALVPRRGAGCIMAVGAAAAALGLHAVGFGNWQPAPAVALLSLGPAIDIAMLGSGSAGWWLYTRFALAGVLANSLAFFVRMAIFFYQLNEVRPRALDQFGVGVYLSYAACGAIAGLLGAAVCFRFSCRSK